MAGNSNVVKIRSTESLIFKIILPLQAFRHTSGMQKEYKDRKKYRDPETCCTPPLAEDIMWTTLDDDPFGVYTSLGGRSSPVTPPPLRAVRLTYPDTVEKIAKAFEDIRTEAFKHESTKEVDLREDLASHDYAIKKFKNFKTSLTEDPTWKPARRNSRSNEGGGRSGGSSQHSRSRGRPGLTSSLIMRPVIDRPCTPKCPGSYGILPSMQCVICKAMFHAKCQGIISPNLRVFKCKRCLNRRQPLQPRAQLPSAGSDGASVKLKLPMIPKVSYNFTQCGKTKSVFSPKKLYFLKSAL